MDFLDPVKKRALRNRLIAGYFLIGTAILLVTLILVFQSYGYDLDRKTGSIIQNGLLFVSSEPVPSDIYLNGKQVKSNSDARLVLPSDVYKLELKHDGYRTWQRTISLAGASIDRVVYPFLFPTKLNGHGQRENLPTKLMRLFYNLTALRRKQLHHAVVLPKIALRLSLIMRDTWLCRVLHRLLLVCRVFRCRQ